MQRALDGGVYSVMNDRIGAPLGVQFLDPQFGDMLVLDLHSFSSGSVQVKILVNMFENNSNKTNRNKPTQHNTTQNNTTQNKTKQNKTKQNKTTFF